jgi:hypothetical protein
VHPYKDFPGNEECRHFQLWNIEFHVSNNTFLFSFPPQDGRCVTNNLSSKMRQVRLSTILAQLPISYLTCWPKCRRPTLTKCLLQKYVSPNSLHRPSEDPHFALMEHSLQTSTLYLCKTTSFFFRYNLHIYILGSYFDKLGASTCLCPFQQLNSH